MERRKNIASAQIRSFTHDTEENIRHHLACIDLASGENVGLILFPEMSLTGYEKELAKDLAFEEQDTRLLIFKERAVRYQMVIIAGAPVRVNEILYIGSFVFTPDGKIYTYTKQFLHAGEEVYFSAGFSHNQVIDWEGEKISIAICADIVNPLHAEQAFGKGAKLYAAGIFYTPGGIHSAYEQLSRYAMTYDMHILMANYTGSLYGLESAGKSAYWNNKGKLLGQLDSDQEGLLIVSPDTEKVLYKTITQIHEH